jgi:hypothetical protein
MEELVSPHSALKANRAAEGLLPQSDAPWDEER